MNQIGADREGRIAHGCWERLVVAEEALVVSPAFGMDLATSLVDSGVRDVDVRSVRRKSDSCS